MECVARLTQERICAINSDVEVYADTEEMFTGKKLNY